MALHSTMFIKKVLCDYSTFSLRYTRRPVRVVAYRAEVNSKKRSAYKAQFKRRGIVWIYFIIIVITISQPICPIWSNTFLNIIQVDFILSNAHMLSCIVLYASKKKISSTAVPLSPSWDSVGWNCRCIKSLFAICAWGGSHITSPLCHQVAQANLNENGCDFHYLSLISRQVHFRFPCIPSLSFSLCDIFCLELIKEETAMTAPPLFYVAIRIHRDPGRKYFPSLTTVELFMSNKRIQRKLCLMQQPEGQTETAHTPCSACLAH